MTDQPSLNLDFACNEVYECGAALVTFLAFPTNAEANQRPNFHASLCAKYLRDCYLGSENEIVPIPMKPIYALRAERDIKHDLKTVKRRFRDRMWAAHIAMGYLQKASGITPVLPRGVSKLSVNAMAAHVAAKIGQSEPENVETRIWRPSLPVIHLAAAVAIAINDAERTGRPKTSAGDILFSQSLIEEIVDKAMCYERLIANHRMPIKASRLIKVRIVSK